MPSAVIAGYGLQLDVGAITGKGVLDIQGELDFGLAPSGGSGITIGFINNDGVLQLGSDDLDASQHFDPTISGFSSGDEIQWLGQPLTAVSYAAGTLSLITSYGTAATLSLTGDYRHDTVFSASTIRSTVPTLGYGRSGRDDRRPPAVTPRTPLKP